MIVTARGAVLRLMLALLVGSCALLAGGTAAAAVPTDPDLSLALPPDSGEDQPASLGTGADIYFDAELRNVGAAGAAHLTITLPTGLALGADGVVLYADQAAYDAFNGTTLTCSGTTGTVTCPLGTVAATGATTDPPLIEVDLLATPDGVAGTSATFTVAVAPDSGADATPSDDQVQATIDFTGIADLSFAITPSRSRVVVGRTTTLTLTVTNHGPQPATDAIALSMLDNDSFDITGFDGATTPPGTSPLARTMRALPVRRLAARMHAALPGSGFSSTPSAGSSTGGGSTSGAGLFWFPGTIPSGGAVTAHLTVKAIKVGTTQVGLIALSTASDPDCVGAATTCVPVTATLTAVAAPVARPTHHTSQTPSAPATAATAPLANSGTPDRGLLVLALALTTAGAGLTYLGRRRCTAP